MPPLEYCDVKQPNLNHHAGFQCPRLTCPLPRYSLPGRALNLLPAHPELRRLLVSLRLQVRLYSVPSPLWSEILAGDNTTLPVISKTGLPLAVFVECILWPQISFTFIQLSGILHLCVALNTLFCRPRKYPASANLNTHSPRGADQCVVLGFC